MAQNTFTTAPLRYLCLLLAMLLALSACATTKHKGDGKDLPPVLAQDELIRPYVQLGRIDITIDKYFTELDNVREWGLRTLREEANKMQADAIMFPEFTAKRVISPFGPCNQYRAVGVAIKFK